MAQYNTAANLRLHAVCGTLDDRGRKADRGAFFRSIHGTLNHLMVGDLIWLARFEGNEVPSTGLDSELYAGFDELTAARRALDARIEAFFAQLTVDRLRGEIAYVSHEGRYFVDRLELLLPHFFNHQTHHRGQAHALLSQAGISPPSLDLHRVLKPGR